LIFTNLPRADDRPLPPVPRYSDSDSSGLNFPAPVLNPYVLNVPPVTDPPFVSVIDPVTGHVKKPPDAISSHKSNNGLTPTLDEIVERHIARSLKANGGLVSVQPLEPIITAPADLYGLQRHPGVPVSLRSLEPDPDADPKYWVAAKFDPVVAKVHKLMSSQLLPAVHYPDGLPTEKMWDLTWPKSVSNRFRDNPYTFFHLPRGWRYPKQDCLIQALSDASSVPKEQIFYWMLRTWPKGWVWDSEDGLPAKLCDAVGCALNMTITVLSGHRAENFGVKTRCELRISFSNGHFTAVGRSKGMIISRPLRLSGSSTVTSRKLVNALSALPVVNWFEWYPEFSRSEAYVRELAKGTTGTFHETPVNYWGFKSWEEQCKLNAESHQVRMLSVIEGDPGCRKSSAIQKELRKLEYHRDNSFQVSVQTNILCQDWKNKINAVVKIPGTGKGLPDSYCCTFEKALANGVPSSVFITDEDKLPYGYMALKALLFPDTTHFIRLGDRYQAQWHEPNGDCLLNSMPDKGEGEFYASYSSQYLFGTWRFGPDVANLFGMPTFASHDTHLYFSPTPVVNAHDVHRFLSHLSFEEVEVMFRNALTTYPSDADVRVSDVTNLSENITHSSSQGRGEDLVIVVMTDVALKIEDYRSIYAALTRAKKYLIVCMVWSSHNKSVQAVCSHPIFCSLDAIAARTPPFARATPLPRDVINIKGLIGELSPSVKRVLAGPPSKVQNRSFLDECQHEWNQYSGYVDPDNPEMVGGHSQLSRDDPAYVDAHQFLVHVTPLPEPVPDNPVIHEPSMKMDKLITHLPIESRSSWLEDAISKVPERVTRELSIGSLYSQQFPDEYLLRFDQDKVMKNGWNRLPPSEKKAFRTMAQYRFDLMSRPDSDNPLKFHPTLMNWGQLQDPNDRVSFKAGIEQRIKFSTLAQNQLLYQNHTSLFGPALFDGLKRGLGIDAPIAFDPLEFELCIARFSERRAERPQALKKASIPRSEPDFRNFLTAKRQLKMKDDEPPKAKPLQTILLHGDEYLFLMGPVGIYMLDVLKNICPPHIFVHAKESYQSFDLWCKTYVTDDPGKFESDITGFDANCDHNTVKMFELFMRWMSIPEEYISFFLDSKSSVVTQYGVHAFATFSGEIFTWLINTTKTISRRHTKWAVPWGTPQAYTGDDEYIEMVCPERPEWIALSEFDGSIEKPVVREFGTLASFILSPAGAMKDPTMLLRRLLVAESRGKIADVYTGYFLDFLTIYNKAELALPYLTEQQQESLQILTSEMFNIRRRAHLVKSVNLDESKKIEFYTTKINSDGLSEVAQILSSIDVSYTNDFSISAPSSLSESATVFDYHSSFDSFF